MEVNSRQNACICSLLQYITYSNNNLPKSRQTLIIRVMASFTDVDDLWCYVFMRFHTSNYYYFYIRILWIYIIFWVMQYIRLILLVHVYGSIPRVGVLYLLIKYLNSYSRVLLLFG